MMITPSKRRSFAAHQNYYKGVRPRVESRWESGTPLLRRGKIVNKRVSRRRSDSELLHLPLPLSLPSSSPNGAIIEERDHESSVPFISISEEHMINQSNGAQSKSISMDVSEHMEVVSFHFKDLFSQLERYLSTKKSDTEKHFVEKQMKDMKEHASQIEFMISDLTERASRLENFLANRLSKSETSDDNLEWSL